jgi:hypothetical protein
MGFIFLIFTSCKSYHENEYGGYRPKRPKFKLANPPYQLKNNDVINTNGVYVHEATIYYGDEARKEEFFIRFFANGRFYRGIADAEKLTLQDMNNINGYGSIGYYELEDKRLKMEEFRVGGQFGTTPYYNKMYAIVKNDSILFVREDVNEIDFSAAKKEGRSFYVRRKVQGLTGTPDW